MAGSTAGDIGGGVLVHLDATCAFEGTDFADNAPEDAHAAGAAYDWGAGASFTCSSDTGCE